MLKGSLNAVKFISLSFTLLKQVCLSKKRNTSKEQRKTSRMYDKLLKSCQFNQEPIPKKKINK